MLASPQAVYLCKFFNVFQDKRFGCAGAAGLPPCQPALLWTTEGRHLSWKGK